MMSRSKVYQVCSAAILVTVALLGGTTSQYAAQTLGTAPALSCATVSTPPELASTAIVPATPDLQATEAADAPVQFTSFLPTDLRFNPDTQKPVAMVIVFSLIFQNRLDSALHIESPRFKLAIDGVPWGNLSSTDFQTGQMLSHAEQGIVLQSLTLFAKITPDQAAIVPCLVAHQPVDLTLSGTILAGDTPQPVAVNLTTRQVIIRERP
jgi:hypothetical protein